MTDSSRLQLHAPTTADTHALLAFELDNRAHFETWVAARAESYYSAQAVAAMIEQARREREADQSYQFLAKLDGQIVGRVNLTAVTRPCFNKAQLGYRIGAQFGGRGCWNRRSGRWNCGAWKRLCGCPTWRRQKYCSVMASISTAGRNRPCISTAPGATCCISSAARRSKRCGKQRA